MMAWSRRHTLVSGIALILVVNAVALAGVFYNRSGEPESRLKLSQRELRLPYRQWNNKENSGVELSLVWRVPSAEETYYGYGSSGGTPVWLDKAKLAALGFDVSQDVEAESSGRYRQQSKDVLLVLELDGPAYRQNLERTRQSAQQEGESSAASQDSKELAQRAKAAKEQLRREERESSRLFVVDAGLDLEALRAQYPDRARFLIAHGQIRPQIVGYDKERRLSGYVTGLSASQINVPVVFQNVLKQAASNTRADNDTDTTRFEADVAFGKRLEPWIVAMTETATKK
jgi:hypothetical protein